MVIIEFLFVPFLEAGFSEDWTSTNEERSRQRQVEVQANIATNPNRPTEYRTVTAPQAQAQSHQELEAEERKCVQTLQTALFLIETNHSFQVASSLVWEISFSTPFLLAKRRAMVTGTQPSHAL